MAAPASDIWHKFFDAYAARWRALDSDTDGAAEWRRWVDAQDVYVLLGAVESLGRAWDYKRAGAPRLPQVQAAYYAERDRRLGGKMAEAVEELRPCDHCQDSGYVHAVRDVETRKFVKAVRAYRNPMTGELVYITNPVFASASLNVEPVYCSCARGKLIARDKVSELDRVDISDRSFDGGLRGLLVAWDWVTECYWLAKAGRAGK